MFWFSWLSLTLFVLLYYQNKIKASVLRRWKLCEPTRAIKSQNSPFVPVSVYFSLFLVGVRLGFRTTFTKFTSCSSILTSWQLRTSLFSLCKNNKIEVGQILTVTHVKSGLLLLLSLLLSSQVCNNEELYTEKINMVIQRQINKIATSNVWKYQTAQM